DASNHLEIKKAPASRWGRLLLELSVSLEDRAAPVPHPGTVGREGGATPEQVAPGHAAGPIAEPGRGGPAGRQIFHVDGVGGGGGQSEKQNPKKHFRHVECRLPSVVDLWGRSSPTC